jgi:hypothetical protein
VFLKLIRSFFFHLITVWALTAALGVQSYWFRLSPRPNRRFARAFTHRARTHARTCAHASIRKRISFATSTTNNNDQATSEQKERIKKLSTSLTSPSPLNLPFPQGKTLTINVRRPFSLDS